MSYIEKNDQNKKFMKFVFTKLVAVQKQDPIVISEGFITHPMPMHLSIEFCGAAFFQYPIVEQTLPRDLPSFSQLLKQSEEKEAVPFLKKIKKKHDRLSSIHIADWSSFEQFDERMSHLPLEILDPFLQCVQELTFSKFKDPHRKMATESTRQFLSLLREEKIKMLLENL